MPPAVLVFLLGIVFTAVLASGQGLYWAWVSRKEREQEELLRRLGSGGGATEEEAEAALFKDQATDSVAGALGAIGDRLQTTIRAADANITVSQLLTRSLVVSGVAFVMAFILMGPIVSIPALLLGYLPIFLVQRQATTRLKKLVEQLPDALELMARALSAGVGLSDAFRLVSEEMGMPIAAEFGRIQEEVRFGRDYREAFDRMLERNPGVFDLRIFVSSIMLQRDTGGNLIEILESIADTIRARFLFDAKVAAMTSEAKASAMILGSLPFAVLIMLSIMNPEYLTPLFQTFAGNCILAGCATMYMIGGFLMYDMSQVEV